MPMRSSLRAIAIFVVVCTLAVGAITRVVAQTDQQMNWCLGKDGATPDLQIAGCTAVIQSGKYSGEKLAFAFSNRCQAHNDLRDRDNALADCNQAIQLDPKYAIAYNTRGVVWRAKGDHDRAIADYSDAIRLNPN